MAQSDQVAPVFGQARFEPLLPRRYWVLIVMTMVYAVNIADRFALSSLIEPIKAEFRLSDSGVGLVTGTAFALCHALASLPAGRLADRTHRRNLIAVALAVWSIFTGLCGVAQNFVQLLFARFGVGLGEAGATPAAHSILADYFPPAERVIAMSVFAIGITIGSGFGGMAGGIFADHFGWRFGLILVASINLAILALLFTVHEPERGGNDAPARKAHQHPTLGETLRFVRGSRALMHLLIAGTIADFAGGGLVWWTPAFLLRSHGFTVGEAGLQVGLMGGVGGTCALLLTALATIRLARFAARWQCWFLVALTGLLTIPGVAAYAVGSTGLALALLWLFVPFINAHVGPTLGLLQNLAPRNMRGQTVAILLFAANLANLAVAPQLIGGLSDLLAPHLADPSQSLRITLALCGLSGIWAAWHFWAAMRTLPQDLIRAAK
ncbi:MAG: MFS transporter [Sphingomonadales bacterium]|nr:MFS transporter [Sphingomonadales bacterium]